MNLHIVSVLAVLVVCYIGNSVSHHVYIVVPDGALHLCPNVTNRSSCLTTQQLGNISQDENISLIFSQGKHWLSQRYTFLNISFMNITGDNKSTISCQAESGFSFENIGHLVIENLELKGCTQSLSNGRTVSISNVDTVEIKHSNFYDNTCFINGCALQIENSDYVLINKCMFYNNTAGCLSCEGGALYVVNTSTVVINQSSFEKNTATSDAGAISIQESHATISNSHFFLNSAVSTENSSGGAIYSHTSNLNIFRSIFVGNIAIYGGALSALDSNVTIIQSTYMYNRGAFGGALSALDSNVMILQSTYMNNGGAFGGALSALDSNVTIIQTTYTNNRGGFGGAIYIHSGYAYIEQGHHSDNIAQIYGGVIFANNSMVISNSSSFTRNSGEIAGGVIGAQQNTIISETESTHNRNTAPIGGVIFADTIALLESESCVYSNNSAKTAGAILTLATTVRLNKCIFKNNIATLLNEEPVTNTMNSFIGLRAVTGGAIIVVESCLSSSGTVYTGNKATHFGGAIYALESTTNFEGDTFSFNEAEEGAAVYATANQTTTSNSTFTSNQAFTNGVLFALSVDVHIKGKFIMQDNNGSISTFDSYVFFQQESLLVRNKGTSGGAINSIQSIIEFEETSAITIQHNTAILGGGISLIESSLIMRSSNVVIENNKATDNGGGIYAIQSQIEVRPAGRNDTIIVASNIADLNGGGFYAIASQTKQFRGHLLVENNHASGQGGAFYLSSNSKIYINKIDEDTNVTGKHTILTIVNNNAAIGGAVYTEDTTNTGSLCRRVNSVYQQPIVTEQCFLQIIQLYINFPFAAPETAFNLATTSTQNVTNVHETTTYSNVVFANNTATDKGNAIYGGLLDRCTLNPFSELTSNIDNISSYNGFDYLKLMVEFEGLADYERLTMEDYPFNIIRNISKSRASNLITSDAVRVCFCTHSGIVDCAYSPPIISIKKGETFKISLVAVDQLENPTRAKLISTAQSASGVQRLKEGQGNQFLNDHCTEIQYNVFASDNTAQVQLYTNGPCGNLGISARTLNINFITCTCPVGFIPVPSDIECICQCHNQLMSHVDVTKCKAENHTVRLLDNVWIGLTDNESDFIVHQCPFNYCVRKPLTLGLDELRIDEQCANNRTGNLCGRCQSGLSLVLGSSRCVKCSSFTLFLLIPFALAGIVLVVLILLLNMTVATGTINGLIFYANILGANHAIFLTGNSFTVFIAWVNLDLGIETCFYHGMDAYGKLLLQLVFPAYLIFLTAVIITASKYSNRLSAMLGKRNPIATLSTLILLSYSKLLRTTIEALQHTTLKLSETPTSVWLIDATVAYLSPTHIPRFIIAILIILVGSTYTVLLLFGQCFHLCSKKAPMKWVRNPKYNAFIDAYHASLTPKNRYWVGLLLLLRIFHYMLSAFATQPQTILSVGCVAFFIILLKLLNTKTYKVWLIDTLETSFIINLGLLTISTYFIMLTNGEQETVTNISVAIAFVTFFFITCYHTYEYILKSTTCFQRLTTDSKVFKAASKYIKRLTTQKSSKNVQPPGHGYRDSIIEIDSVVHINSSEIDSVVHTNSSLAPPVSETTFTVIETPK